MFTEIGHHPSSLSDVLSARSKRPGNHPYQYLTKRSSYLRLSKLTKNVSPVGIISHLSAPVKDVPGLLSSLAKGQRKWNIRQPNSFSDMSANGNFAMTRKNIHSVLQGIYETYEKTRIVYHHLNNSS